MQIKNMIVILIISFIILGAWGQASAIQRKEEFLLKYIITVNNQEKGALLIINKNNSFDAKYSGTVDTADKLSFYAKPKKGIYQRNGAGLARLEVGGAGDIYEIYTDEKAALNDVKKIVSNTIQKGLIENRSFLFDRKSMSVKMSFEQIPLESFESFLTSFICNMIKPGQEILLFEPLSNNQFKLSYENAGVVSHKVSGKQCNLTKVMCNRVNVPGKPPVHLFTMYVDTRGVPISIVHHSERWRLDIAGFGREKEVSYPPNEVTDIFAKDVLKKFPNDSNIETGNYEVVGAKMTFVYKVKIPFAISDEILKKYLASDSQTEMRQQVNAEIKTLKLFSRDRGRQVYSYFATDKDVCAFMKKSGRIYDDNCRNERVSKSIPIDYERLNKYVLQKGKILDFEEFVENEMKIKKPYSYAFQNNGLIVKSEFDTDVSPEMRRESAVKLLLERGIRINASKNKLLTQTNQGFNLEISEDIAGQVFCSSTYSSSGRIVAVNSTHCVIESVISKQEGDVRELIEKDIRSKYTNLKYTDINLQLKDSKYIFPYLVNYFEERGEENACR